MSEAARLTPYSAEYLSLLARKGKLSAKKIDNVWFTTKEIVEDYMRRQMLRANIQNGALKNNYDYDIGKFSGNLNYVRDKLTHGLAGIIEEEKKPETQEAQSVLVQEIKKLSESLGGLSNKIENISSAQKENIVSGDLPDSFALKFNKFLDSSISEHFGITHKLWRAVKNSFKAVFSRPVLFFLFIAGLIFFVAFPARFIFGFFDDALDYAYSKLNDANTVLGFRPGTHENEILLLDKKGNVSISGHIETEGQFRSFIKDGVAPIMVDSKTKVENLNADYFDKLVDKINELQGECKSCIQEFRKIKEKN